MPDANQKDRLLREQEFHDQLARELDPESMPPTPLNQLDQAMVEAAGNLEDKQVLDLGCGAGDLSLVLARAGARTTGIDISPAMVDVARRRVARFLPEANTHFLAAAAEELPLADNSIDIIVGRFILHHLDIPRAARECARILRPGGIALFVENSGRNPLLMFARNHLAGRFGIPRYGTADERPLSNDDIATLAAQLPYLQLEYPVFDFFALLDRQIFRHRWRSMTQLMRALDRLIWNRIPAARAWSFRVLVISGV
jgi:ubiquinone/menaquinone biosynthesis C-methylase UbiE